MKQIISAVIIALCLLHSVQAQDVDVSSTSGSIRIGDVDISVAKAPFMQGGWELTAIGSFGSMSRKTTDKFGSYTYNNNSSTNYGYISLMPGYYIVNNLSIEPEFSLLTVKDTKPGETVVLNISYTLPLRNSIVALFVRAGYGLGNATSVPILADIPVQSSDKFDVNTIKAGGGLKLLVAQGAALRIEVGYQHQSYTAEYGNGIYSGSTDYSNSVVRFGFGFSVLL